MADRDRVTHTIYCSLGTFLSITDYLHATTNGLVTSQLSFREVVHRGIKYIIDDSLAEAEMYSRREVKGGSVYYYN